MAFCSSVPLVDDYDFPEEDYCEIMNDMDRVLEELGKGQVLSKVKSPNKLLLRKFSLNPKHMVFQYDGSQKKIRRAKNKIKVSMIQEVREGEIDYSGRLRGLEKPRCLAVVFGGNRKVMYLMMKHKKLRDMWLHGLRFAVQTEKQRNETERWVRDAFIMADKNHDGNLDLTEVIKLLKTLNADMKEEWVKQMFEKADTKESNRNFLDRQEFVQFYHALTHRPELEEIFLRYSNGKCILTIKDLLSFLRESQKIITADEKFCRELIGSYEPNAVNKQRDEMTMEGFRVFLTSDSQHLFNPEHSHVYQDMTRPMTHYFIASSHNTYLSGNQLNGPSNVEEYIDALSKGCRCVELDCWDGPNDEPVIFHGYTLTSKILFRDVIMAVKRYAFKASVYPLTLSLENHCSVEQQRVMAKHMTEIFGDMLWHPDEELDHIPSPQELRGKIIIKGKKMPDNRFTRAVTLEYEEGTESSDSDSGNIERTPDKKHRHAQIKLCPELSRITGMTSVRFADPEQALASRGFFHIFSLSENRIKKLLHNTADDINRVSHHKLLRIYPAGYRVDSSNFNPVPMWNHGCQLIALNYQTDCKAMQLNQGKFVDNGRSGYILKPSFLLSEEMFGVVNGTETRSNISKQFSIRIISGHKIPKPSNSEEGEVVDPFVKIEVHGVPSDNREIRTKTVKNNGFNPRWNETFSFDVRVPELALLRFVLIDEDRGKNDFIGYHCLPFTSVQEGYRHFPLCDKNGDKFSQTLIFAHITITTHSDS